jgi:hypothetical protein
MLNNLSNKYRCYVIWGASLFGCLLVYFTLVTSVMNKIDQREEMVAQLNAIQYASTHIKQLEKEIGKANKLLGTSSNDISSFQQELLSIVSQYSKKNNLVLRDFPEPTIEQKDDFLIETNIFEVSGKYKNLVQLVYLFEQKQKIGKVASVSFQKKKDIINRKEYLSALVYIQNIRKNE